MPLCYDGSVDSTEKEEEAEVEAEADLQQQLHWVEL